MASTAKPCHVLHVDDSADDRALFARAFAKSGLLATLHSLPSVSEALLFLNKLGPHARAPTPKLMVLDLSMPRVDGRTLLENLRKNYFLSSLPVVVLTGSEDFRDMRRSRELGVDEYVVKPSDYSELAGLIASFDHYLVGTSTGMPPAVRRS